MSYDVGGLYEYLRVATRQTGLIKQGSKEAIRVSRRSLHSALEELDDIEERISQQEGGKQ